MNSAHPDSASCLIPAFSKRQVMDWSLVLASQGIAATIVESDQGWGLLVRADEYDLAIRAIQQYRRENRSWPWRQPIPWSQATFHWGSLFWCWALLGMHWLSYERLPQFRQGGEFATERVAQGEWWRAFTAILLHTDLGHLLANVTTGFLLLGLAMARYGAGPGLLAAYLAGAAGNLLGLTLAAKDYVGVGASGMVMGALGLITIPPFAGGMLRNGRHLVRAGLAGVFLFLIFGANPASDVVAHVGGFAAGILLGIVLNIVPGERLQDKRVNGIVWGLVALLVAGTGWLALRGAGSSGPF